MDALKTNICKVVCGRGLEATNLIYCMFTKSWPFSYSVLQHENGQDFLGTQYKRGWKETNTLKNYPKKGFGAKLIELEVFVKAIGGIIKYFNIQVGEYLKR